MHGIKGTLWLALCYTACGHRMAHRKWKETKQEPGTAGPGNRLGCCLVSFHFLWAILCPEAVYLLIKVGLTMSMRLLRVSLFPIFPVFPSFVPFSDSLKSFIRRSLFGGERFHFLRLFMFGLGFGGREAKGVHVCGGILGLKSRNRGGRARACGLLVGVQSFPSHHS